MERVKRVIFIQIGTEVFTVEIDQIKRFVDKAEISGLSDKGDGLNRIGMICLYDEVIPVLDLHRWFGQKPMNLCKNTIFAVMMFGGKSFAFPISAVIGSCEVSDECFYAVPAVFEKESRKAFREVVDWNGKLYLKICGETILRAMMTNTQVMELWENTD